MLRVGLTGGLGSGKSTAARLFAAHGAHVLQSDAMGREMMEPGEAVYAAIVNHFGKTVVLPDGRLDRVALAKISLLVSSVRACFDAMFRIFSVLRSSMNASSLPSGENVG